MLHYTGWAPEFNLYPDARAQPVACTYADAADYYAAFGIVNDVAPRYSSLLSIDGFLLLRPQEWAILGPNTKVSFRNDLLRVTSAFFFHLPLVVVMRLPTVGHRYEGQAGGNPPLPLPPITPRVRANQSTSSSTPRQRLGASSLVIIVLSPILFLTSLCMPCPSQTLLVTSFLMGVTTAMVIQTILS